MTEPPKSKQSSADEVGGEPESLAELALDLRWTWKHDADALFEDIEPELWRETGNAWAVVRSASPERLRSLWSTPSFRDRAAGLAAARDEHAAADAWFQRAHRDAPITAVAYFSLEFALSEALPIYSGGLGNVAGDLLKTASDLGVPLVGVGLLYQQGYFRQAIDASGNQHEFCPFNYTSLLPIAPLRDRTGDWVRVRLPKPGPTVWLRGWEARVGRTRLLLLDSNDPSNAPADRGITSELYGGGPETRLLQEMALGIGGYRLLRAVGIAPEVCHLNEGHAALVALERARDFMTRARVSFDVALAATRAGNIFTTHTPVEAGFDRFEPELVRAYLGRYADDELKVSVDDILALGRARADDAAEPLNMAWLAVRGSGAVTAVSRVHADVSRKLFQVLFPRWPEREVPIGCVTNGIHVPSWDAPEADALWTDACGPERWRGTMEDVGTRIADVDDERLWTMRAASRAGLVSFVRERLVGQLAGAGIIGDSLDTATHVFDGDTLTLGLARRFTAYKRPALLLHDPDRFARILANARRPVQIVVAGKAHPRDEVGKQLIAEWIAFVRRPDVRRHAVFIADYDLRVAERLVQGVDLWVNTPLPPWEACGTSGMKVLVNGGLNLSSRDGWWAEAYRPELGWALPAGARSDAEDADHLYDLLEREIVPAFYERDATGIPREWVGRMRASMSELTPRFSANRALRAYVDEHYVGAAAEYARRAASDGAVAKSLVASATELREHWPLIRFGELAVSEGAAARTISVAVYLDGADAESVRVELYADCLDGGESLRIPMRRGEALVGSRGFTFEAEVPAGRAPDAFTPRLVPTLGTLAVPLEVPLIGWQR